MDTQELLQKIIEAHGGLSLWNRLEAIEADISARGFLFTVKHRPVLTHVKVTAKAHDPRFLFHDFPAPGLTGELIGNDEVRITEIDGKIVDSRFRPRSTFKGFRRMLWWDALDFIYFAGYATWNYLISPFLFLRDGIHVKVLEPCPDMPPSWTGLRVTFPDDVPVHCKTQQFYFDENRLLRRFDYTAEVVGQWARAAQLCENYRDFDGLKAPARRRVLPMFRGSNPMPGPTLVDIEIHDLRLKYISPEN
jgi:hypothetical protein